MQINQVTLEQCAEATDLVVVVDVLRAFTTAAFAFDAGVGQIGLVGTVKEAFAQQMAWPNSSIMGEVGGYKVDGFDFGNSPTHLLGQDLARCWMVQRTSAGTQGVVRSVNASAILVTSFVCASATVAHIWQLAPAQVTFVNTGVRPDGRGDEDVACSDYLSALLRGETLNVEPFLQRVRGSVNGRKFVASAFVDADHPAEDVTLAMDVDRFDFGMQVFWEDGVAVLRKIDRRDGDRRDGIAGKKDNRAIG